MMRAAVLVLLVANAVANDVLGLCACAKDDPKYPFTINCADAATIRGATDTLESDACETPRTDAFEWAGTFDTPNATYIWVAQAATADENCASKVKYADATMKLVAMDTTDTSVAGLFAQAAAANTAMAGTCPEVEMTGTNFDIKPKITVPAGDHVCVTLKFPASCVSEVDFVMDVVTPSPHVAFYTEHVPTEFERSVHYFQHVQTGGSNDATGYVGNLDIEPVAQSSEYCKIETNSATGIMDCQQAFLIIQAHHDYCPHDTLTTYEEELFHKWENKCNGCAIVRKYDANLNNCPTVDCTAVQQAELAYSTLSDNCIPKDFGLPFEFAATFDTPKNTYTWVAEAAVLVNATGYVGNTFVGNSTTGETFAGNYTYADPEMLFVAFALDGNKESKVADKQATAVMFMNNASKYCPRQVHTGETITPTVPGTCVNLVFPTGNPTPPDFSMLVNTLGISHVAFFTGHVPTEFERDTHYFMDYSTDPATDVEPVKILGGGAGHSHRRLSEATSSPGRRLSGHPDDNGQCCTVNGIMNASMAVQQGAWQLVVSYHDQCNYNQVPPYIEVGFHQYENSCEDYFCNNMPSGCTTYDCDQLTCPSPPPPPMVVVETKDELDGGALAGIIVASVIAVLLLVGMAFVVSKEVQGKPIFMKMSDVDKANVRTGGDAVGKDNAA